MKSLLEELKEEEVSATDTALFERRLNLIEFRLEELCTILEGIEELDSWTRILRQMKRQVLPRKPVLARTGPPDPRLERILTQLQKIALHKQEIQVRNNLILRECMAVRKKASRQLR